MRHLWLQDSIFRSLYEKSRDVDRGLAQPGSGQHFTG